MTPQPQTNLYKLYIDPIDNWFTVAHPNSNAWSSSSLNYALSCCKEGWQFTSVHAKANTFLCSFNSLLYPYFLEPTFENDHDLGTFIGKASSLDELKLLHPELFI